MNDQRDVRDGGEGASVGSGMFGLLEVAAVLQARVEAALESVGLSPPKYMTLEQLVNAGGSMSLSGLAECRKCVRSNITQLVDRLEADGLVKRIDDPDDRRAVRAAVTKEGKERFVAGNAAIAAIQSELAARVSPDDRASFLKVLAALKGAAHG